MSRLTVRDGTQVAYERQGSGSTVVLVHGGFLDHRACGGLQAILVAAGHTVVAPDRRGHGFSDPYGPRPEVADDAGDLAEIVAAVAEPGTTVRVIAHSSGGHSALAAAALTDSIGDLVLYEPPLRRDDPPIDPETWTRLRNAHAAGDRKLLVELGGAGSGSNQDQQVPLPARGTEQAYRWLRTWWTAVSLLEHTRYSDRAGIGRRWVLRAVGEAAMKTGSRYVAFGVRSLSVATAVSVGRSFRYAAGRRRQVELVPAARRASSTVAPCPTASTNCAP